MTYLLLGVPFVACAALVAVGARLLTRGPSWPAVLAAAGVVLVLTAVFDNVMIGVGLVAYDDAATLGVRLGLAPVEDFLYPVAGVLLLPAVWHLLGGRLEARTDGAADRHVADGRTAGGRA